MTDYAHISKIIQKGLIFLREYSYGEPREEIEQDNLTGDSLSLTYKSKATGIEIDVTYWQKQLGRVESFVVLIDKHPDRIGLSEWVKEKGKSKSINFRNESNLPEDVFIKEFISSFETLCRGDFREILEGLRWDPVPFDYGDFR